jgi:hypothetical protein
MILGMTTSTYTLVQSPSACWESARASSSCLACLGAKRFDSWTALFLVTTVLTSVTGFGFPFDHLVPAHKVAIISLVVQRLRS